MAVFASAEIAQPSRVDLGRITLNVLDTGGDASLLLLHGFPECAAAWTPIIAALAPRFRCIAPDQRGYGLSDRPGRPADYALAELIEDVAALLDKCGLARATIVGHDWGGVVAAWFAARHPKRVERLVLINGPHPAALQEALLDDPAQRAASAYITAFRQPGAAERLMAGGAAAAWATIFGGVPSMAGRRDAYIHAWSQPGAAQAMLDWYRASPFVVPGGGGAPRPPWLDAEDLRVRRPTLAIWGMRDHVLLPRLLDRLADHIDDLQIERIEDAGHAVIHEQPSRVAELIERFTLS